MEEVESPPGPSAASGSLVSQLSSLTTDDNSALNEPVLATVSAQRVFHTPELLHEILIHLPPSAILNVMITGSYGLIRGAKELWRTTDGNIVDTLQKVLYSEERTALYRQSVIYIINYGLLLPIEDCKDIVNLLLTQHDNLSFTTFKRSRTKFHHIYWQYYITESEKATDSELDCNVSLECGLFVYPGAETGDICRAIDTGLTSIFDQHLAITRIHVLDTNLGGSVNDDILDFIETDPDFFYNLSVQNPWTESQVRRLLTLIGESEYYEQAGFELHFGCDSSKELFELLAVECPGSKLIDLEPTPDAKPIPLAWALQTWHQETSSLEHLTAGVTFEDLEEAQPSPTLQELRNPLLCHLQCLTLHTLELPRIAQCDFAAFLARHISPMCTVEIKPWTKKDCVHDDDARWQAWSEGVKLEMAQLRQTVVQGAGIGWVQLPKSADLW